jgi:prolyl-tRNA editing enzyme YbaK/EbsC (Cys-tRNA(Pro) deacylase)
MDDQLSSLQQVQQALQDLNLTSQVLELPSSTRTAREAAQAVGCTVNQIVKSLVFQTVPGGRPILILTSGANQVDEDHMSRIIGEKITFASPDFVRDQTGFTIGGVSPFGLQQEISTYLDQDLLDFDRIWAAAGSPRAVFSISPQDLLSGTGAVAVSVRSPE